MQERNDETKHSGRMESYEEMRRKVQQFHLTSDIFFCKVMEDLPACQEVIRILTKENLTVKAVKTQYSIRNIENRLVILDVLAEDPSGKLVNVEIHPKEDEDHVKRVRYYLGNIDVSMMEKGCSFENLPEIYLLYITEKDFIGGHRAVYHVDRIIRGSETLLENGVHEMYVNLQAPAAEPEQRELLRYMRSSEPQNETGAFPSLAARVHTLKEKREGVEIMCDIIERERAEGKAEGKAEVVALIRKKYSKQLSPVQIADLLELEIPYVERVLRSIQKDPGATDFEIAMELLKAN